MDAANPNELVSKEANTYWENVDLYIGGAEHATGHLLYARFWNKFLFDLGLVCKEEPFKKLINQGMILGVSELIHTAASYNLNGNPIVTNYNYIYCNGEIIEFSETAEVYYSADIASEAEKKLNEIEEIKNVDSKGNKTRIYSFRIPINFTYLHTLKEFIKFRNWRGDNTIPDGKIVFICRKGYWLLYTEEKTYKLSWVPKIENAEPEEFYTSPFVEKMSKTYYNVISPDTDTVRDDNGNLIQEGLIEKYGADTLRLYEMFLGPLEQHKPWDTKGIEGVFRFIRKLWKLYHDNDNNLSISDEPATKPELKALHKAIKKE
jgi:leucyl-tRNA synthetase